MSTLQEAIDIYHQLSCNDRIAFYFTLSNDIDTNKNTMQELLEETRFSKGQKCIYCGSSHFVKNGIRKDKIQRYLCRDCRKSFLLSTNSISSGTHKRLAVWKRYFDCMMSKKTLKESAAECEISMGTAFLWRRRILDALQQMAEKVRLGEVVEADETFFNVSYKGNRKKDGSSSLPRRAHRRGNSVHTKGLSNEKVCVVCAVNEQNTPIAKVGKTGKVSSECVSRVFSGRIEPDSVLCTDQEPAYLLFANGNPVTLVQMETGRRTNGIYNIQRINAYHSRLKGFIDRFHGVATKYLDNYLAWYNLMFCPPKETGFLHDISRWSILFPVKTIGLFLSEYYSCSAKDIFLVFPFHRQQAFPIAEVFDTLKASECHCLFLLSFIVPQHPFRQIAGRRHFRINLWKNQPDRAP